MTVLAIETSCDDTCAAVVSRDGTILANVVASQLEHDSFGGVVPEIAARHHLAVIDAVIEQALLESGRGLGDVEIVAATRGPGLIGALLVGLASAKGLAAARRLPFAPVDHIDGHVAANYLRAGDGPFEPPFVCLVASGGHTLVAHVSARSAYRVLGRALDDAAGEAFDKGARLLGLGYPGGAALEHLARDGDAGAFAFPGSARARRARSRPSALDGTLDFSFAGLKTALLYKLRELGDAERVERAADLAASYQAAIVDSLADRCERALVACGQARLALGGGVAANGELRRRLAELEVELNVPPAELCTDNAAMIAAAALTETPLAYPEYLGLDAYPSGTAR
jgi:N6-L-threonylcarbamoyladenine synthase